MELELPYPPSVNHLWRRCGGRTVLSRQGREYRRDVRLTILRLRLQPIEGPLAVSIDVFPPDRRRRDLDNTLKCLLDALEYGGIYRDDSQIDYLTIGRCDRVPGGKVRVLLEPYSEQPPCESLPIPVARKRSCLKCDKAFDSDGPANRICPKCQRGNARIAISEGELEAQRGRKFCNGELLRTAS